MLFPNLHTVITKDFLRLSHDHSRNIILRIPTSKMYLLPIYFCLLWIAKCENIPSPQTLIEVDRPSNQNYSVKTHICCNGNIQELNSTNNFTLCCGDKTFNPDIELCCFTKIYIKKENEDCCGNQTYNTQTQVCSSLMVKTAFAGTDFRSVNYKVGHNIITPHFDKTNLLVYTCDDKIIYLNESICCDGKIISGPNLRCCNNKTYDPDIELCCLVKNVTSIVKKTNPLEDKCCQGIPYNSDKKACLNKNGTITDLPGPNKMICGDEIIDKNEKLCCYHKHLPQKDYSIKKMKSHHVHCCGNTSYSRFYLDHICCDGQLSPYNEKMKCCPGNGVYDIEKDTCCSIKNYLTVNQTSKLYKGKLGKCCHLDLYDEEKEYCCGVSIVPIGDRNYSGCCHYQISSLQASNSEIIHVYQSPKFF